MKKILALILALVMVFALCACGTESAPAASSGTQSAGSDSGVKTVHHKIGIAHYTDAGKAVDAMRAFLEGIAGPMDIEFVYATLSTYDEATNLTAMQNLISSGCEGILMSADMGTTAILEECASAGVYVAGFLCDYNQSYWTANEEVFGNEYFLGTVCDGHADIGFYAEDVAAKVIEGGYKHVGVVIFPEYAYPNQAAASRTFREKIDAYNATAAEADKIEVYDDEVLNFSPLDATYFSNYPEMDCLFSVAAGASFVYPVMVAAGKTNIPLFTSGFEGTEDADNFGTAGNGCFKGTLCSTPEAMVYPLCLMIDKLNGTTYADLPEKAERVDCSVLEILSDEDMAKVKSSSLYYSAKFENSFLTADEVINLCASYNPSATYANLVDTINHMSVADLK
ncbi:MAG: sugar ABC transporter substrate-binding protein [Oscillospiraceae bacterium]|nr:sugar ABC transporter substrate-binding protein [Oscillospiraceae bacterium]